ncbi:hypothetical protein LTR37_015893 [Vermiconidia calcicola]|uniref:Uncharacterized protein n=1 Tax=Vermiconidia calcicola TaxID=1690605 RepID=A0ACC3MS74_9PEZI|nr:hypothetical protein LTR37_015893 [Vermiconidia calcicola]
MADTESTEVQEQRIYEAITNLRNTDYDAYVAWVDAVADYADAEYQRSQDEIARSEAECEGMKTERKSTKEQKAQVDQLTCLLVELLQATIRYNKDPAAASPADHKRLTELRSAVQKQQAVVDPIREELRSQGWLE